MSSIFSLFTWNFIKILYMPLIVAWLSHYFFEFIRGLIKKFLFVDIRRVIAGVFIPGVLLHELTHSFAAKLLKLQVLPYGSLTFGMNDRWGGVIREVKEIKTAFLLGYAPSILIPIWIALYRLRDIAYLYLQKLDAAWLILVYYWILVSLLVFGFPRPTDVLLPWTILVLVYPKSTTTLFLAAILCLFAMPLWGWLLPTLNWVALLLTILFTDLDQNRRASSPSPSFSSSFRTNDHDSQLVQQEASIEDYYTLF